VNDPEHRIPVPLRSVDVRLMNDNELNINVPGAAIRKFYGLLFAGNALLILATALSDLKHTIVANLIGMQLDLKLEGNFAVWYSSMVLLLGAMGAFAIGARTWIDSKSDPFARYLWVSIGLAFLGLSMDETAQLHEKAGMLFTEHLGRVPFLTEGGRPAFAWLLIFLPLVAVFLACMMSAVRWLRANPLCRKLALSGMICWIGVLLAEFYEAQVRRWSMQRSLQGVIEEGLELTGATLFLIAFVEFLRAKAKKPAGSEPSVAQSDVWGSEVLLPLDHANRKGAFHSDPSARRWK
jgi:hypothetical protein